MTQRTIPPAHWAVLCWLAVDRAWQQPGKPMTERQIAALAKEGGMTSEALLEEASQVAEVWERYRPRAAWETHGALP